MTTTFGERLDDAASYAICRLLDEGGGALTNAAALSLATGNFQAAGGLTGAAGIAYMAERWNCQWDPDKPGFPTEGGGPSGCQEASGGGVFLEEWSPRLNQWVPEAGPHRSFDSFTQTSCDGEETSDGIATYTDIAFTRLDGTKGVINSIVYGDSCGDLSRLRGRVADDGECTKDFEGGPKLPIDNIPSYQYTDESSNCTINVETVGFTTSAGGGVDPVFKMSPSSPDGDTRNTGCAGGRTGGCCFSPVLYHQPGGPCGPCGPRPPFPPDKDNDDDWWHDVLKQATGVAIGNLVASALKTFFEAQLAPASFTLIAPCDKDEQKNPLEVKYALPIQNYQSRVLSQQAVIMEILQQHLNWKTPICFEKNESGRYFRSISFESEAYSPNSNARINKRFRYRSESPGDVRQLATHWALFEWNTGPVVVKHSGSPLGSPQVWASSVDEGKRVIQHAGAEAGIDPDQVGEWSIGGSDNSRYGVYATVKLKRVDGCWAATARQGPDGWPEAAY